MKHSFGQGISTGPEVDILMGINLDAGKIVEYQLIETMLRMGRRHPRFRTIMQAWTRRVFREQRLQHAAERGIGIRFLTDSGALEHAIRGTVRTAKAERRIATKVRAINTVKLTEYERKQHELHSSFLRARDNEARQQAKLLAEPKPVVSSVTRLHSLG